MAAAQKVGQYALPLSGAPRDPGPRTAPNGQMPSALVLHHTSDNLTPQQIVRSWQTDPKAVSQRIGSQYIVDRDGKVINTLDLGHKNTNHTRNGTTPETKGIGNRNTVGFEVIAKNDKDVLPAQVKGIREFIEKNYPDAPMFGHGQIDPDRKEADEGMTALNAIKEGRAADAKMAAVSELAGGAEGGSKTALASMQDGDTGTQVAESPAAKQYALPAKADATADVTAPSAPSQYSLPQASTDSTPTYPQGTDPMTAGMGAPKSSFNYQSRTSPELQASIENTANQVGVHPSAIAGMIGMESRFDPHALSVAPGGTQYRGLTQMQEQTFREQPGGKLGGMTWQEYQNAKPEQQAAAYGDWLKYYGFNEKAQAAGVNLSEKTPAQQNAYLQGFQFGPNATQWQKAYGEGKENVPTTPSQQASALSPGTKGWKPTMETMTDYFNRLHGGDAALGASAMAKAPKVDIGKAFETAAEGAAGGKGTNQYALPKAPTDVGKAFEAAAKGAAGGDDKAAGSVPGAIGKAASEIADARANVQNKAMGPNMGYDLSGVLREITGYNERGEPVYKGDPKQEAPKVETAAKPSGPSALQESKAAGAKAEPKIAGLGSGGDARMDAQIGALKAAPLAGTPPVDMPPPASPEPPGAPIVPSATPGPLDQPGADQGPAWTKLDLPDPGPLVPNINVPPVNEGANKQLADAFGGAQSTPAWAAATAPAWSPGQDTTPTNLFGETPTLTGTGPGSILPAQPQLPTALADPFSAFGASPIVAPTFDTASASAGVPWIGDTTPTDLYGSTPNLLGSGISGSGGDRAQLATIMHEQQNNDLEINPSAMQSPGSLADASGGGGGGGVTNPTTYSGGPVGPGQVADSNWGIIVPPVHTPLPGPETMNYGNFIAPSTWAIINAPGVGLG